MKNFIWEVEEKDFFLRTKETWKLDVMQEALQYLDNPHKKIENKVIHIAGTNGKGSTASYIKTILEEAGYKVGLFTSPHLVEYNERIYFNNRFITDKEIEECKSQIIQKCKNVKNISFFEATTLIAILMFAKNNLDYCVFEVGLGGRLDATNIFEHPLVSVITSISFDHMKILGNTLQQIAKEKAGIIKNNVPVFTSNTKTEIIQVLQKIADEKNTKLYCIDRDFSIDKSLTPSLLGNYQFSNATLAKEVCKYIGIEDIYIKKGISNTKWLGRLQKIHINNIDNEALNISQIYLDGAHNEDGIKQLCEFVKSQKTSDTNIIGIMACLKRKNYYSFFEIIKPDIFNKLLFFNVPKTVNDFVEPEVLREIANKNNISNDCIYDFQELKEYIKKDKKNIVFIFGSLYFVGFVLDKNNHFLTNIF